MGYLAIEDYGVIGDMHSIALVGIDGSIDWCCLPYFDSPSVFAGILDDEKGGWFRLSAKEVQKRKQYYLAETNILVTRSYTANGLGQVENFMPIVPSTPGDAQHVHRIVRRVSCIRGTVTYDLDCTPAFDYARAEHTVNLVPEGVIFEAPGEYRFALASPVPLLGNNRGVSASVTLKEGESATFTFLCAPKSLEDLFSYAGHPQQLFDQTERYWHRWIGGCTYDGRWSDDVYRSALVLKLLTFEPTGAIVAAPTMGLPEEIGGTRNWDYRYTWIRDASFSVYGLMRIGLTREAERFMEWVTKRLEEMDLSRESPISLMYRLDGSRELEEANLSHLKGYKGSWPVRLGNGAYNQLQLDIFGELMDSIYLFNKYGKPISYRQWSQVRRLMGWICRNWDQPDEGIWETRGGRKNFVFSRLMCWVALDRASRMCIKHGLPGDVGQWIGERDRIYDQIMTSGWNSERHAFRQHYETGELDAANLLMPLVKFISPYDPRMLSTIDATLASLTTDSLVFRYDPKLSPDGIDGGEGTFSICTFWLIECLTRAGRLIEARELFQKMLGYGNHVGLFGEEIGLHGETLGNFPQAFTHLGLISAAYNLDRALTERGTDLETESSVL